MELFKIECSVGYLKTSLNQVIGDLVFWPADTQIYSSTGCKRVSQKVDQILYELDLWYTKMEKYKLYLMYYNTLQCLQISRVQNL